MKKLLCVIFALIFVFSLSACKKDTGSETTSPESTTAEETTELSMIPLDMLQEAIEALGISDWDSNYSSLTSEQKEAIKTYFALNGIAVKVNDDGFYYTETTVAQSSTDGETTTESTTVPVSLISKETLPTGKQNEVETKTDGMPVNSLAESAIGSVMKSGKYTMKFNLQMEQEGTEQNVPVTAYIWDKKTALETSMDMGTGQKMSVSILSTGSEAYLSIPGSALSSILPTISSATKGVYMLIPDDQFKEFFPDLTTSESADVKYSGTEKVTYNGVNYICETYSSKGIITKYYFNDGSLKRIEITDTNDTPNDSSDDTTSILENIELKAGVDESVFKTPKEKGYMDISLFSSILGL